MCAGLRGGNYDGLPSWLAIGVNPDSWMSYSTTSMSQDGHDIYPGFFAEGSMLLFGYSVSYIAYFPDVFKMAINKFTRGTFFVETDATASDVSFNMKFNITFPPINAGGVLWMYADAKKTSGATMALSLSPFYAAFRVYVHCIIFTQGVDLVVFESGFHLQVTAPMFGYSSSFDFVADINWKPWSSTFAATLSANFVFPSVLVDAARLVGNALPVVDSQAQKGCDFFGAGQLCRDYATFREAMVNADMGKWKRLFGFSITVGGGLGTDAGVYLSFKVAFSFFGKNYDFQLSLKFGDHVDQALANYIKDAFGKFGDWIVAKWNEGLNAVSNALVSTCQKTCIPDSELCAGGEEICAGGEEICAGGEEICAGGEEICAGGGRICGCCGWGCKSIPRTCRRTPRTCHRTPRMCHRTPRLCRRTPRICNRVRGTCCTCDAYRNPPKYTCGLLEESSESWKRPRPKPAPRAPSKTRRWRVWRTPWAWNTRAKTKPSRCPCWTWPWRRRPQLTPRRYSSPRRHSRPPCRQPSPRCAK